MTTLILVACSILVASVVAWLFRNRLANLLPNKNTMNSFCAFALIALLVTLVFLPDILILVSTMKLLSTSFTIVLALAVASVCIGCSQQAEAPQPHPVQWRGPETGYTGTSTLPPADKHKEGP